MRSLTSIEADFLKTLKSSVQKTEQSGDVVGAYVTDPGSSNPALQVGLRLKDEASLVYFTVLIYGTRPVRYHLEAEASSQAAGCRLFWNRLLGALNLVLERSGEKDGRLHLFYEVGYSDKELKRLGEK